MNPRVDLDAPKLCNNCIVREERRVPKVKDKNETIDILIKCDKHIQKEIEEICISRGLSFGEYFISLHELSKYGSKDIAVPEEYEEDGADMLKDVENILKRKPGRPRRDAI